MKNSLFSVGNTDFFSHNAKIFMYPDNSTKMIVCSRAVFREGGWEQRRDETKQVFGEEGGEPSESGENFSPNETSLRQARRRIFDIAMMNNFDYFVTITFDKEFVDRYSPEEVLNKLNVFTKNAVRRKNLRYLLVPELHKDGAIHCHGLMAGDLKYVFSGVKKKGKKIFNISDWKCRFTTATKIRGTRAVSAYITKYITKNSAKIFGNYYLAGGEITRQVPFELVDVEFDRVAENLKTYESPIGDKYVYVDKFATSSKCDYT